MVHPWNVLEQRGRVLAEEAGAGARVGRGLDPAWLDGAARWLADGAPPWAGLVGDPPSQRAYRLIVSSLHLEAWLICWPEAGRLVLHDHGGASGALRVVDGTLTEQYLLDGRPPVRRRHLGAGGGISFDGDYLHDVGNLDRGPASSIHVYGAAERPMQHYRVLADGRILPVRPAGPDRHPAGSGR